MAAAISRVFNAYQKELPKRAFQRAMLSGFCAVAFQLLNLRNSNPLGAGALATVASLVDSHLRPFVNRVCLDGINNDFISVGANIAVTAMAVFGSAALVSGCGLSIVALKVSEMVSLNVCIQLAFDVGNGREAIPYIVI